ncbi:MAG: ATPase, T2SS/T4P/T4SS family [Arhodomonas sp.]|nr:ATPase, T2SS/T4P/T4SS family [Arhodomonas sp.]
MPHGIVLVTGPTGSGKTTTLYTALSRLNTPERKVITVEDPVESRLRRHQPGPDQEADRAQLCFGACVAFVAAGSRTSS